MWKRLTIVLLLVLIPLTAGNAAAVSGLENDEVPSDFGDLFDIDRHGVPVAGWLIMGLLFIVASILIYYFTGSAGTYIAIPIGAIGVVFMFYGVVPNLTAIILGMVYGGIVVGYLATATGIVQFGI